MNSKLSPIYLPDRRQPNIGDLTPEERRPLAPTADEIFSPLNILLRNKLFITLVSALVTGVGITYCYFLPPTYTSSVILLIGSAGKSPLKDQDVEIEQPRNFEETQAYLIQVPEVAERVVKALKLTEQPAFDALNTSRLNLFRVLGLGEKSRSLPTEADAISAVLAHTAVQALPRSQLIQIEYVSSDKTLSAMIANSLADEYIARDIDERSKQTLLAGARLQDKLEALRSKLAESELALRTYKDSRGLVNIGGSAQMLVAQQAGDLTNRLVQATAQRAELEIAYKQVKNASDDQLASIPAVIRDSSVSDAIKQLNEVKRTFAEASQYLGPSNAKYIEAKAALSEQEKALRERSRSVAKSIAFEYESARQNEENVKGMLAIAKSKVSGVNQDEFQLALLEREVQSNRTLFELFLAKIKEADLTNGLRSEVASIASFARPAANHIGQKRFQIVSATALLGFLLSSAIVLVRSRFEESGGTLERVELALQFPVLAALPKLRTGQPSITARAFFLYPESLYAEAIRTARTAINLSPPVNLPKRLLITSTRSGEGKTSLAINLAMAHSQIQRTLLIDADLRNPQVGRYLHLSAEAFGISDLLGGDRLMKECVHLADAGSELFIIPAGTLLESPLEFLSSHKFRILLEDLSKSFDVIIIDSPPLGIVSDALVLASFVTGTICVVNAATTPLADCRKILTQLRRTGARVEGIALNRVDGVTAYPDYAYASPKVAGDARHTHRSHDLGISRKTADRTA